MNRRRLLAGVGAAGLSSLAGCLGLAGLAEHEATPAGVAAAVREDTGYEQTGVEEVGVEEEFSIAFYSESVVARNYLTEHEKAVEVGPLVDQRAAIFTVLTTPQVSVLGQEFNPVEEMSPRELVELIESNYDDLRNAEHQADETVEILGQETTASRFSADAVFAGQNLEVAMHVSEAVEAGEDWLVTIGVYPRQLASQEEANVHALMEAVTEDVEEDADGGEDADGDGENGEGQEGDGSNGTEDGTENGGDEDDGGLVDL